MEQSNTLIVIPTYQEAENIAKLVEKILVASPEVNILFVDDNSTDGTRDIVRRLQEGCPAKIFMLERPGKLGLGSAYRDGFSWASKQGYARVIQMDADFSHDPSYLPEMIESLNLSDVAIGSRYIAGGGTENWGVARRVISRGGSWYARTILGVNIHEFTGGFNGWHTKVLDNMRVHELASEGYSFQIELKHRAHHFGYKLLEFPIVFRDRVKGTSKMSTNIVIEAALMVWRIRFNVGHIESLAKVSKMA